MTDRWLPTLPLTAGVKYQAIFDALGAAVESGVLRAGDRLPPQRELAAKLGVDLTTVTKAYEAARLRGFIEARGRAGSFVCEPKHVEAKDAAHVDSAMNMPPELPGSMLARALAETSSKLLLGGKVSVLQYQTAGGAAADRAAGAQMLSAFGLPSDEHEVVITAGGQNALHAILAANFTAGDAIACGTYVYSGFRALAHRLGLRLVPLAEMTAEALKKASSETPLQALYVVPTNDNPTALTLPLDERIAMAKVAAHLGIRIIEDDAYGPLAAEAIPPIAAQAPDLCWYIGSTSKLVSPALRVAFVRAPSIGSALKLADDVHETTVMAPPLNAAIVSEWIRNGSFSRFLGAMRAETQRRQELARGALGDLRYSYHPEGYHLWVPLREDALPHALVDVTRPTGLTVVPSDRFAVGPPPHQAVRVSIGGLMDAERMVRGLRLLHGWAVGASRPVSALA